MKNLLKINLFLFTYSSKKLIFVFILLLILPLTGCKSVVKETVVEEPVVVVEKNGKGVLYRRFVNGEWGWYKSGNEEDGKYVGEIENGIPNGQGTTTWSGSDGEKYVGEYKDGERNGQGTTTFPNGNKYEGELKDGKPWNGTYDDKNGNIIGKYVNGEWIKQ